MSKRPGGNPLARAAKVRQAIQRANARQALGPEDQRALAGLTCQQMLDALEQMDQRDRARGDVPPPVPRSEGVLAPLVIWANIEPEAVSGTDAACLVHGMGRVVLVADDRLLGAGP